MTEKDILHRWDGAKHADDFLTYQEIFDEALDMLKREEKAIPALLMVIINEWEKDERSVPYPVISAALDVARENEELRRMADELRESMAT